MQQCKQNNMEGEQEPSGGNYLYHSKGLPSLELGLKLLNYCQEAIFGVAFSNNYVKTVILRIDFCFL